MRVKRLDFTTVDPSKFEQTPSGGWVVPAALTRTGVFIYRTEDGQEVREYRSPQEVFSPASMASAQGAPITVNHPPVMVVPDNWSKYAKGHIQEGTVAPEESFLVGKLAIEDGPTLEEVKSGKLRELSCGYSCDVEASPGTTTEGERYDTVQKNIVYNHVALGPQGWGRAGSQVGLRLDSKGDLVDTRASTVQVPRRTKRMKTIHLAGRTLVVSGVNYPLTTQEGRAQARQALKSLVQTRMDEATAETMKKDVTLEDLKAALMAALSMLEEMAGATVAEDMEDPQAEEKPPVRTVDQEGAPVVKDQEEEQKKMDSAVELRATILEKARKFLPTLVAKGKANSAIMRETLDSAGVSHKDLSDEAVYGAFLTIPERRMDATLLELNRATHTPAGGPGVSEETDPGNILRQKYTAASKLKK
jgi:hypothetical protein